MTLTIAFLAGALCGVILGVLVGAQAQATVTLRQHRRRRNQINRDGSDAVECWLADIDWQRHQPSNGTPFEGDEVV